VPDWITGDYTGDQAVAFPRREPNVLKNYQKAEWILHKLQPAEKGHSTVRAHEHKYKVSRRFGPADARRAGG